MPYVKLSLAAFLLSQAENADVAVPVVRSYYEPLCAVYRRTCLAASKKLIERGGLKVSDLYNLVRFHEVSEEQIRRHDTELRSIVNENVPSEIAQWWNLAARSLRNVLVCQSVRGSRKMVHRVRKRHGGGDRYARIAHLDHGSGVHP
jgi:hypothetical protein